MDSYNLFGEDGSGMLEGLTDLGGADSFASNAASGVAADNKDSAENSYRQSYTQPNVAQEGSIQKLAAFGTSSGSGTQSGVTNPGPPAPEYHEYGTYPPRPRVPQPPHGSLHPPYHVHPSHSHPGYHPGPEPMYTMPEQPGMGDMWSNAPGANRYAPLAPGYRHGYEHQQKLQYPPQQGPGIASLQPQNGAYLPRQPHFPQPTSQQLYGQQNYPNYTQMHPPSSARMPQHPNYHQQMDVNPHQYGLPHGPQNHNPISQHQPHQNIGGHAAGISPAMQGHPNVHLHHVGPGSLHHVGRQPAASSTSVPPSHPVPSQLPYGTPHHMGYQSHQGQHPLDVNVSHQFNAVKSTGMETGSPQYRPPFAQHSPQMSPRAQMSPRQQNQPQLSPRPVMSPVKGPSASPHNTRNIVQSPVPSGPQAPPFSSQNNLQALEQMVLPTGPDYAYQRNPSSPAVGNISSSPSHWAQNKIPAPVGNIGSSESNDGNLKNMEPVTLLAQKTDLIGNIAVTSNDTKVSDQATKENDSSHSDNTLVSTVSTSISNDNLSTSNQPILGKLNEDMEANGSSTHPQSVDTVTDPVISKDDKNVDSENDPPKLEQNNEPSQQMPEIIQSSKNERTTLPNVTIPSPLPNISGQTIGPLPPHTPMTHPKISPGPDQSNQFENLSNLNQMHRPPQGTLSPLSNLPSTPANLMPLSTTSGGSVSNLEVTAVNASSSLSSNNMPHNVGSQYQSLAVSGTVSMNQQSLINVQPNVSAQQIIISNTSSNPHENQQSLLQSIPPSTQGNLTIPSVPNNLSAIPPNSAPNVPNMQMGIHLAGQGLHPGVLTNQPNVPNNISIQPNIPNMSLQPNIPNMPIQPNVPSPMNQNMMMMGPNPMNHPNMPPMYPPTHHQERMALQQQIQEIYCLTASNENQEKIRCIQERLTVLQQHEINDKCNGGPNCILQSSVYGSKMVESPQVTSTTGRGRGKGPSKPRKPRAKKDKNLISQSLDQLPVSEDCVTAGTGLLSNIELDTELGEEIINLDGSGLSEQIIVKPKKRGPKPKNKEGKEGRKARTPKEPKLEDGKPIKERKKRQPRDPNAPKRKRNSKKEASEVQADTTTCYDFVDKEVSESKLNESLGEGSKDAKLEEHVTDFDDIPVSKIAIKDLLEEAEAKRDQDEKDEDFEFLGQKKRSKKRASAGSSCKKVPSRRSLGGKRRRRGGIVPDSDGEPDDMVTTPPPSPPAEDDSLKRRSARNTQRKKYTDDVMLRLSDDEFTSSTPKLEKNLKLDDFHVDAKDIPRPDATPKPNYMYVNTADEDSMIVQNVLASRMGKRELKIDTLATESLIKDEQTVKTDENKFEEVLKKEKEHCDSLLQSFDSATNEPNVEKDEIKEIIDTSSKEIKEIDSTKSEFLSLPNKDIRTKDDGKPVLVDVEEYFVKYRNFSYLHCEWKTEEELYKGDKRIFSKIKRFKQKQAQQMNIFEMLDDEPFNPDYVEVERILDMSENEDTTNNTIVKHYLVKWKSLQYEDSTWELEENVDVDKIRQFKLFTELPPKDQWKYKKRPSADNWVQLKESPLYKGGNTLRPYQLEGLNWLLFSWHNGRNCILADEMGLGKTIQSLTFVNAIWEYGIRGPFLIIAPLSTIPNWQREFEGWTEMNVVVYHGSQQSKSMIQEYEFYYKNDKGEPIKDITKFNVLITTFEIIVTDFQELKSFNWRICVIDEAHRLKNRNCKLLEGLRQLHLEHRVLLSGTPLQNNVNELFSLLNFLEPSQFASSDAFLNEFGQLKSESEVLKLQALLKPMMLRRLKEDVEKTLAPKEETVIEVELTNIQKKYYRAILERNFSFLQKGITSAANIPNLMNTMMELRKCCIHPYLLNGAEDQIQFDYKQAHGEDKAAYYKALIQSSGKMVLVDKLLPKLKAGGHRVLIFSQMVRCLDILEDYLLYKKYPFERIDGRIRGNLRQEAIDRFSKPDSDRFVFLLCTKAGGLGINLTAADTVIIYDSDWNPQNDLQAQARCHRIGQQKMVKIYRLVCRNTYEREMFDKASLKLGLDKAILQSMNTGQGKEAGLKQLSKKEIEDLLKKGAYGAVMDEDNAGDKFCEEDIEMILARRTQIIQMASEKGSTFSKASFAANDQRSDIDIRDPDFWNKWAKKAEIDTTDKKEDEDLIVTEPRKRTVIKRYGHDDGTMEMSDEATPDSEEDEEGISLRSKKKKERLGRKGRKYAPDDYIPRHEGVSMPEEDVVFGSWTRSECFKIERGLLTFGWGRWDEIVDKNQFRKGWTIPVIEDCARIIVLFCLRHYKGDEKIRNFIWDLIEPCENGEVTISRNHSGLHNPVPRGRNAKKKNKPRDIPKPNDTQRWEDPNHWSSTEKYDCDSYLESSYKKHLIRHANKVLLRVRMMYYIKHEVIGDYANHIENGSHASSLGMRVPRGVDSAPPRLWWDTECDVSLLVGTYVHGYENYLAMRSDPQLCFVDKLGPPDDAECTDIKSEERLVRASGGDEDCTDEVSSGAGGASPATSPASPRRDDSGAAHLWPSMQDLNTRLRRLITAYQRNYKREELKMQQRAKMERREQLARDEAAAWRWSRADEEAFRRTVASYGVEFDPSTKSLRWSRFRTLARLDSKSDDALTDYLKAFMAMCKRQCGLTVGEAELPTRADLKAEPIGEERAIATLERIDLLRVLREEVAAQPALEARLAQCDRGRGAPPWWAPPAHDRLLVLAVCKHGLGDTYNKIFCDPKLPFADCAAKWYGSRKGAKKETPKATSDDESHGSESEREARQLRRSKRTSAGAGADDDTDALSELETLAKLGRVEPPLPPDHWFSERALETRLHHIAHTVQNSEWKPPEGPAKRHIAIDVETERAKLHALLASPASDSDSGSRRSTPAPRHAAPPSDAGDAPVDLSAPRDLFRDHSRDSRDSRDPSRDSRDTSRDSRDPSRDSRDPSRDSTRDPPPTSRLDDSLSKLMKRKNVPAPEQIVGKENKRKKLDDIVKSLAKGRSTVGGSSGTCIPPDVTVTPAAPPSSAATTQRPFSVTVTSVPSPHSAKESSFLQQSLEQTKKSAAAAAASKAYSHEAKVNKWLAEQAARRTSGSTPAPPRLAPDEHVPVVHRGTGKRLVGHKAPQLKHLAQWVADNPLYDIDPKWTESIKEHIKLPQDVRSQRHSPLAAPPERKKGRPPTLDSTSANVLSSSAHLNQNLAGLNPALLASLSAFDPKTLAATLSNLTGFDPKLLSGFDPKLLASLSSFDPKNNPLLSSFSNMPNLLGNIAGGNIFANLAGLGLPGFPSLDMNALTGSATTSDSSKSKSRKPETSGASTSKSSSSSQFPFVFPNPNMLYPQLGLGGLNPFGMHSGMSSAYDALGLLGNNLAASSASSLHALSRGGSKTTTPRSSTVVTSSASARSHKPTPDRHQTSQLPQIMLPTDPYLLESLSKQSMSYDALLRQDKRARDNDALEAATDLSKNDKKKTPFETLRSQVPPEFAAVQEKLLRGDKKDLDISKMLLEQMASGALSASLVSSSESKKILKDAEKEVIEKSKKATSEYLSRSIADTQASPHKRTHEEMLSVPENLSLQANEGNLSKKAKDAISTETEKRPEHSHTGEMDLEDLIAPSTVIKTGMKPSDFDKSNSRKTLVDSMTPTAVEEERDEKTSQTLNVGQDLSTNIENLSVNKADENIEDQAFDDGNEDNEDVGRRVNKKKTRKLSEENVTSGTKRELRSSAGRQSTESTSSNH